MHRILLAIDGLNVLFFTNMNQCRQRHFGAVTQGAEHGFTKHSLTDANKVKTRHKLAVDPSFSTVCIACLVKCFVGGDHFWHDPGPFLTFSRALRAGLDDLIKVPIKTQFKGRVRRSAKGFFEEIDAT